MRRHFPKTLLLATLLGSVPLAPGFAQTAPSTDAPSQSSNTPGQPANPPPVAAPVPATQPAAKADADQGARDDAVSTARVDADRSAFFEAHVAALRAGLTLTPDQEKLWPPLEQAIRGIADLQRKDRRSTGMTRSSDEEADGRTVGTRGGDAIAKLKQVSGRMMDQGRALGALADASGPLYDGLTDEQKRRLPVLLEGLTPRRGPVARMVQGLLGDLPDDELDRPRNPRGDRDRDPDERDGRDRMRRSGMDEDRGPPEERDARDRSYEKRGMETRRKGRFDEPGSLYGDRDADRQDRPMHRRDDDESNGGEND